MADVALLFNILARDNTAAGLNSASSRMDKFKARTSMAALGILGASAAIGTNAVKIASDVSESQSKVATLLGKSAGSVQTFAASSATAFGMSKREALNAVGGMAAVLKAQGASDASAAKLSLTYTKLSADLGSFNNASSADVQEALTASLSGEYEMLKRYGIVVNDSTMAAEAQRIGMEKTGATWTTAQKKTLSYNIIMASTTKAQGDFARTSGGLANQSKIMSARMEDLQGKIGAKLLPVVVKIAGKFNELLGWVERNKTTTKVFATVVGVLAGAIIATAVALKAYALAQRVAAAVGRALYVVTFRLNTAFLTNPVFLVVAGLVALAVVFVLLWKRSETFRKIVTGAFNGVKVAASAVWGWIKAHWPLLLAMLAGPFGIAFILIRKHFDAIRSIVTTVWGAIKTATGKVRDFFVGAWDKMRFGANVAIKAIGGGLIKMADVALGVMEGMLRGAGHLPRWLGGGKFDRAADAVAGIRSGLRGMKDDLDRLPTSKKMEIQLNTAAAMRKISELRATKAINIAVNFRPVGADSGFNARGAEQALSGARAGGGPVGAGGAYLVGEQGPEVLVMGRQGGTVVPNATAGRRGRQEIHLVLEIEGTDPFVHALRKSIRVKGGNVQAVLGS